MTDIRDTYDQAAAHHAIMSHRQRGFGLPAIEDANQSVLERTLEVEVRVRNIVRSACAGDRVTPADCFAAIAHLVCLARTVEGVEAGSRG